MTEAILLMFSAMGLTTVPPPLLMASSSWLILSSAWASLASVSCFSVMAASSPACMPLPMLPPSSIRPRSTSCSIRGSTSMLNRLVALKSGSQPDLWRMIWLTHSSTSL